MDYATAGQRIAAKQREYIAQGRDASTALKLATEDLPEETKVYAIRYANQTRAVSDAEDRKKAGDAFASFSQNYQLAHPGANLATCYKAFAEKYPTLAKVYSTPLDMRG